MMEQCSTFHIYTNLFPSATFYKHNIKINMLRNTTRKIHQENTSVSQKECDFICSNKQLFGFLITEKVTHFHRSSNKSSRSHHKNSQSACGIAMSLVKNPKSAHTNQSVQKKLYLKLWPELIRDQIVKGKIDQGKAVKRIQSIIPKEPFSFKNQKFTSTKTLKISSNEKIIFNATELLPKHNSIQVSKFLSPYQTTNASEAKLSTVSGFHTMGIQGNCDGQKKHKTRNSESVSTLNAHLSRQCEHISDRNSNNKAEDDSNRSERKDGNHIQCSSNKVVRLCDTARLTETLHTQSQSERTQMSEVVSISGSQMFNLLGIQHSSSQFKRN